VIHRRLSQDTRRSQVHDLRLFGAFKERAADGKVLVPNNPRLRDYDRNPYVGYDSRDRPYPLFQGDLPSDVNPMLRVVVVGDEAWTVPLLREKQVIQKGELTIRWAPGQTRPSIRV
jgi:hypothetical protein